MGEQIDITAPMQGTIVTVDVAVGQQVLRFISRSEGGRIIDALRGQGHGSVRLEWLRTLASAPGGGPLSGLRLHTQLFNGYGDSLLDYNRRRTVFSVGMSLVDW